MVVPLLSIMKLIQEAFHVAVYTSSIAPNSKLSGQARVTLLQQKLLRCVDLYPFYEAVLWNRNSEIT